MAKDLCPPVASPYYNNTIVIDLKFLKILFAVKAKREEKHGFLIKMINCQCSQHKCFSDKSDELSDTTNRVMILKLQNIKANEVILQKLTLGLVSAISLGCLSIVLLN